MFKIDNIKEAFVATAILVFFTCIINFLFLKFDFFKSFKRGTHGFDLYDFYSGEKGKNNLSRDTNIILIQIENDRDKIAEQINIIKKYEPAVIGIDVMFDHRKDSAIDFKLEQSFAGASNIVYAYRLTPAKLSANQSNVFITNGLEGRSGYIDLIPDRYSVITKYSPFEKINSVDNFAFTSRIIQLFSKKFFQELEQRNHSKEAIKYKGNIDKYTSITKEELNLYNKDNQLQQVLKNKIVLFGYFIKDAPLVNDDLFFSPLNSHVGNNSTPDMYGIVIHANILSMILDRSYPKIASTYISFIAAFIFTFLLLLYIIYIQSENDPPSYSKILLIQFLLILFVLYFFLKIYNIFSWKTPLLPILISLVLCVESLRVYKFIALRLHKKMNYKTIYTQK